MAQAYAVTPEAMGRIRNAVLAYERGSRGMPRGTGPTEGSEIAWIRIDSQLPVTETETDIPLYAATVMALAPGSGSWEELADVYAIIVRGTPEVRSIYPGRVMGAAGPEEASLLTYGVDAGSDARAIVVEITGGSNPYTFTQVGFGSLANGTLVSPGGSGGITSDTGPAIDPRGGAILPPLSQVVARRGTYHVPTSAVTITVAGNSGTSTRQHQEVKFSNCLGGTYRLRFSDGTNTHTTAPLTVLEGEGEEVKDALEDLANITNVRVTPDKATRVQQNGSPYKISVQIDAVTQTTATISPTASVATIRSAIESLSHVGSGNAIVEGPYATGIEASRYSHDIRIAQKLGPATVNAHPVSGLPPTVLSTTTTDRWYTVRFEDSFTNYPLMEVVDIDLRGVQDWLIESTSPVADIDTAGIVSMGDQTFPLARRVFPSNVENALCVADENGTVVGMLYSVDATDMRLGLASGAHTVFHGDFITVAGTLKTGDIEAPEPGDTRIRPGVGVEIRLDGDAGTEHGYCVDIGGIGHVGKSFNTSLGLVFRGGICVGGDDDFGAHSENVDMVSITSGHWDGHPTTIGNAINRIAAVVSNFGANPIP